MEVLKRLRKSKRLSQKEVADHLQCSNVVYSRYETGTREPPYDVIVALAKYYGVSTDYILGASDTPAPVTVVIDASGSMYKPDPLREDILRRVATLDANKLQKARSYIEFLAREDK